jgi:hypothetical protein
MAFPAESHFRHWLGYGGPDLAPIEVAVDQFAWRGGGLVERAERGLNLLNDVGQPPVPDRMTELLAFAEGGSFRPLEAQVRRGLGLARRDHEMLTRALTLWEEMGALPFAARVRCERALLSGDDADLQKGLAVLERLGVRLQVGRYERRQVG